MTYTVITTYPKEDTQNSEKHTVATRKETVFEQDFSDVLDLYDQLERSGYTINVSFDTKEVDEKTPFEIAQDLEQQGVDYTAKLTFLEKANQGSYEKIKDLSNKIEQHGFYKYRVDVQLKIADDSAVDLNREATWFDQNDTTYKLTPDVKSSNAAELMGLYDDLTQAGYYVNIDIKPKNKKDEDLDFSTRLRSFPNGTVVKFGLSESE